MYTDILLYFLYYNLQFIFDSLYKNTQNRVFGKSNFIFIFVCLIFIIL